MLEKKILIVEDEGIIALSMKEIIEELGYVVCGIAESGEEAIETAEVERPDLALMDIKLAGKMDGVETAGMLRDRFRTPVVFMSGFMDDRTIERMRGLDPAGVILKPVHFDDLRKLLDRLLRSG